MKLLTQQELDKLPLKEQEAYIDRVFFGKHTPEVKFTHIDDYPRKQVNPIPEGML